ncbi:MAG: hypothetical protein ACFCU1_02405 [Sumerlaeia bacterium]
MNQHAKTLTALFVGLLLGGGVFAVAQQQIQPQRTGINSGPITQVFFSGNKEGINLKNADVTLIETDTKLIDLPVFALGDANKEANGRYQALSLGDGRDFLVLDTRTGLANAYYDSGKVQVFNSLVPNHLLESSIKRHQLGEELR